MIADTFVYHKAAGVLKRYVLTRSTKYFSDDEWHWEEHQEWEEITDSKEKARILETQTVATIDS